MTIRPLKPLQSLRTLRPPAQVRRALGALGLAADPDSRGRKAGSGISVVEVKDLTNAEFFSRFAAPGRIGLVGGADWIDRNIRRAQKGARGDRAPSEWSHAFLFEGARLDGEQWVFESDLDFRAKHVRLGAQENRLQRFFDQADYPNAAVLDFNLNDAQVKAVLTEALGLLARHTQYSLREIAGTLLALNQRSLRNRDNLLAREGAMYCSAFVQHCFAAVDIDFAPTVPTKNTTPEDIAGSAVPHTCYLLVRNRLARRPWDKALRRRK